MKELDPSDQMRNLKIEREADEKFNGGKYGWLFNVCSHYQTRTMIAESDLYAIRNAMDAKADQIWEQHRSIGREEFRQWVDLVAFGEEPTELGPQFDDLVEAVSKG